MAALDGSPSSTGDFIVFGSFLGDLCPEWNQPDRTRRGRSCAAFRPAAESQLIAGLALALALAGGPCRSHPAGPNSDRGGRLSLARRRHFGETLAQPS